MAVKITKTGTIRTFDKGVATAITASDTNDEVTAAGHGITTGQLVDILGHTGSTPDINGQGQAVTVVDADTFTIDGVDITVAGNADGTVTRFNTSLSGENDSFVYLYDEIGDTVEIKHYGKPMHRRTPLAEYTDNLGAGFADFAAFLTYIG